MAARSRFELPGVNDTGKLTAYILRPKMEDSGCSVEPKTVETKVNGKKVLRLNYTRTIGQKVFHYALFITRANKNMLLLEFSAPDPSTLETSIATLQSLYITKPAKAK